MVIEKKIDNCSINLTYDSYLVSHYDHSIIIDHRPYHHINRSFLD
jgi:hypothetical protein